MTSKEVNLASVPGDSGPIPPRFWWLKRILLAAGVLLVLLVVLRLWWGWYASRQLQAEIDRIVASGEPIYPEDFDPKEEISDEFNAAKMLQKAAVSYKLSEEQEQAFFAVFDHDKPITDHIDVIQTIYVDNDETFGLIRRARDLDKYDWGVRIRSPVSTSMRFSFSEFRVLCKLLCLRVEMHYVQDEDSEAIESLLDNLGLGRALAGQPSLISQMVAWPVSDIGASWTERFVIPAPEDARHVEPALARELIRQLLNGTSFHEGLVRAFEVLRMEHLDLLKELESGRTTISAYFGTWQTTPHAVVPDWVWRFGLAPQLRLDMVRVLQKATRQVEALRRRDFEHLDLVVDDETVESLADVLIQPFGEHLFFHRAVRFYLRNEANRRLAAVGLALRLYRAEHGKLPARLEELVPHYLESLPMDSQATPPRLFTYQPDAPSPIVYGVGDDGVDDGGDYAAKKAGTKRGKDLYFFLNGDRPVPKPESESTDAAEDDGEVKKQEREDDNTDTKENNPENRQ